MKRGSDPQRSLALRCALPDLLQAAADLVLPIPRRRASGQRSSLVFVVPPPPLVRLGLRIALRRVLPIFLAAERGDVEVAPGAAHGLVSAAVDEVRAVDLFAVMDERVRSVPLVDT